MAIRITNTQGTFILNTADEAAVLKRYGLVEGLVVCERGFRSRKAVEEYAAQVPVTSTPMFYLEGGMDSIQRQGQDSRSWRTSIITACACGTIYLLEKKSPTYAHEIREIQLVAKSLKNADDFFRLLGHTISYHLNLSG